jgi:hypothetical protein
MEWPTAGIELEDAADEESLVHAWRAEQLARLGLSSQLADAFAASVDWHAMAELASRGCPSELALEILR